jgi:serine/threonine kinase PknH
MSMHPNRLTMGNSEEATRVLPRRLPVAPIRPPLTPPLVMTGWPGPGYPPPPQRPRGSGQRIWIVIGCIAAAATVVLCVGIGVNLAAVSGPDATPHLSAPSSPSPTSIPPTETAPAPTVPLGDLPGLLLDAGTVNDIEGATDIRPVADFRPGSPWGELSTDRTECMGIAHPALIDALRGTGYVGVQTQALRDDHHIIAQAVIDYPSAAAAASFAATQAENWTKCDGKTMTLTTPADGSITFAVGTVANHDGMLTVLFTQEGAEGWACQRALTTRNNIVIDTRSCGMARTDQATTEATRIADHVSAR